jgi:hypothetical protein
VAVVLGGGGWRRRVGKGLNVELLRAQCCERCGFVWKCRVINFVVSLFLALVPEMEHIFLPNYCSKILSADSVGHVKVVFRTTHTQNTTNILILDRDYTMNHSVRHRTTAAIVLHPGSDAQKH